MTYFAFNSSCTPVFLTNTSGCKANLPPDADPATTCDDYLSDSWNDYRIEPNQGCPLKCKSTHLMITPPTTVSSITYLDPRLACSAKYVYEEGDRAKELSSTIAWGVCQPKRM